MKTQDPGSTVREGEFATAQNAAGVPEKIRNTYERVLNGDRLSPKQREEFLRLGQKNYDIGLKQQQKTADGYRKKAARFGLNPDNVISDYSAVEPAQQAAPAISRDDALAELRRRGKIQ